MIAKPHTSIVDEELEQNPIYTEHQLGHVTRDPLGNAYNRSKYSKQRKQLLQVWADYLDVLREGSKQDIESFKADLTNS